jgi:deoxyxylulose-5-phosphate synthase
MDATPPAIRILGVPRTYLAQGKPDLILAELGLDGPGIASTVTAALADERERLHLASPDPA